MTIVAEEMKCLGCALCVLICPQDAMKITPSFVVYIDRKKCNECRECICFCPVEALKEA
jgi:NAD-dependent dihydropyrimidine dehydrogenase PreA subunit